MFVIIVFMSYPIRSFCDTIRFIIYLSFICYFYINKHVLRESKDLIQLIEAGSLVCHRIRLARHYHLMFAVKLWTRSFRSLLVFVIDLVYGSHTHEKNCSSDL